MQKHRMIKKIVAKTRPSVKALPWLFAKRIYIAEYSSPQVLLSTPPHIAKRGKRVRETLVGAPMPAQSPTRWRAFLLIKSAAPKRKTPLRVPFFLS